MAAGFADLALLIGAEVVVLSPGLLLCKCLLLQSTNSCSPEPILAFDGTSSYHFLPAFGSNFPLEMNYLQRVVNYLIMPHFFSIVTPFLLSPIFEVSCFLCE